MTFIEALGETFAHALSRPLLIGGAKPRDRAEAVGLGSMPSSEGGRDEGLGHRASGDEWNQAVHLTPSPEESRH
jgi:hypothetical protein